MEKIETEFDGLFIIQHKVFNDDRGLFVKTYNQSIFETLNLDVVIKERYYSVSQKNVIRGMHFQTPPKDHIKLVNVLQGAILDVVLDIRKSSLTFGKYYSVKINSNEGKTIYIPKGFAHGFLALENNTIVEYNQTTEYAPDKDEGIHFDSFGYKWQIRNPVMSKRDLGFPKFTEFKTIF